MREDEGKLNKSFVMKAQMVRNKDIENLKERQGNATIEERI